MTTSTVRIAAIKKSHATKWVPMLNPGEVIPKSGGMLDRDVTGTGCRPVKTSFTISGRATNRPSTETSFTIQPDPRIARNNVRSRRSPKSGETISTETMSPNARAPRISCPKSWSRRWSTSTISTYTAPAMNAWAASAKLKTPVVL